MKIFRFILPLLLILGSSAPVGSETNEIARSSCAEIVRTALDMVNDQCQQVGRNTVCYGHNRLSAQPHPQAARFEFEQEGDIADVADIQSLQVGGMDLSAQTWGIALMHLQGDLATTSTEDFTLLLFGDVEVENQVVIGSELDISAAAERPVKLRSEPKSDADVVEELQPGETVRANGRLSDGSWLRVSLPDGYGWVYSPLVSSTDDLDTLEIVQDDAAGFGPMRAIKFRSGMRDALCSEAPDSGLLIQTPEGMVRLSLLINGVNVELGSTVYFQAEPGGEMVVRVVEGHATVTVEGKSTSIPAGFEASVPVDEDLEVTGPADSAVPYQMANVLSLPVELLPRPIEIHAPGNPDDIEPEATAESTDTDTDDPTPSNPDDPTTEVDDEGTPTRTSVPSKTPAPPSTSVPPTEVVPPTAVPPTAVPPTEVPPTAVPPTDPPPPEEQITICHKGNTITIDASSWPEHEAHGDTMGPCPT